MVAAPKKAQAVTLAQSDFLAPTRHETAAKGPRDQDPDAPAPSGTYREAQVCAVI